MKRYKCPCGYIYDPAKGEKQTHTPAGTPFEDLPDGWLCPRCGYEKQYLKPLDD